MSQEPVPTKEYPARYTITVKVEYQYEVEADDESQAEEFGWFYEDYAYNAEVHSIEVDLEEEFCQTCGDSDHEDGQCPPEEAEVEEDEAAN